MMPVSHLIIGVDLCPIKPIPNVITMINDITTDKCRTDLRKELKTWKADVVLNDGAPNVGKAWIQDAYSQAELALSALKLATDFLIEGGTFVTKVFRSSNYNSLLWVFNQLFERVEATKPASSRNVSAEIFVVCRGYKAPGSIDPRLLDPKHVFQDVELQKLAAKTNVLHPEKKQRHREGYDDNATMLYKAIPVSSFINSEDPTAILASVNVITFRDEQDQPIKKLANDDILSYCEDLKVIGRKEFKALLRWRATVSQALNPKPDDSAMEGEKEGEAEQNKDPLTELDELEKKLQKAKKREKRKALERKAKQRLRIQLQMENSNDLAENLHEEGLFAIRSIKGSPKNIVEQISNDQTFDESSDEHEQPRQHEGHDMESCSPSESEVDSSWEAELEECYQRFKLDKLQKEALRFKKESSEPVDLSSSSEDDQEGSNNELIVSLESKKDKQASIKAKADLWFSNPIFNSIDNVVNDKQEQQDKYGRKDKKDKQMPVNVAKDDENDAKPSKRNQRKKDAAMEESNEIVFVPAEKFGDSDDEMVDEETKNILLTKEGISYATKLAVDRKKARQELVDQSFNRYAFGEDLKSLPNWFREDEERHNKPQIPLSKEAAAALKAKIERLEAMPSKKVLEAKGRNKRRAFKKLEALKKKAAIIAGSEDMSGGRKSEQIEKIMRGAGKAKRRETKLVVARGGRRAIKGRPKGIKGHYKMVDRRLFKDQRAQKRKAAGAKKKRK